MSIIQDALKKAQGDYSWKKKRADRAAQPEVVREDPAVPAHDTPAAVNKETKRPPSVRLPALAAVLTVLLLIWGLDLSIQYSKKHTSKPGSPKDVEAPPVVNQAGNSRISEFFNQTKINPANIMGLQRSDLVLNGIMYVENRPQAIINGSVLEEGDKINGATILIIEKDYVLLDLGNSNIRLDLQK